MNPIYQIIQEKQSVSFAEFMQLALYHPQCGYYTSKPRVFGREGDFITAPELSPLFGQTLANQCQQIFSMIEHPKILEFGAGSGKLCTSLLKALEAKHALPETYYIIEVSGQLQQLQKHTVSQEMPHLLPRIQWLTSWPQAPINGVILANEVLDAMPVHRFIQTDKGILESQVLLDEKGELHEKFLPTDNQRLLDYLNMALPKELIPYQSEANLFIEGWLKECHKTLAQGVMLIIDYGFPRHEFYHPDRLQGSLMCHYQHRAHPNPFIHVGEQDITAHVDFTHVAEAAFDAGFHVAGFTSQASFLLANGLLSLLEKIEGSKAGFQAQQVAKQLLQPSEMGELFKVIALTKAMDIDLQGFQLNDKRASL